MRLFNKVRFCEQYTSLPNDLKPNIIHEILLSDGRYDKWFSPFPDLSPKVATKFYVEYDAASLGYLLIVDIKTEGRWISGFMASYQEPGSRRCYTLKIVTDTTDMWNQAFLISPGLGANDLKFLNLVLSSSTINAINTLYPATILAIDSVDDLKLIFNDYKVVAAINSRQAVADDKENEPSQPTYQAPQSRCVFTP